MEEMVLTKSEKGRQYMPVRTRLKELRTERGESRMDVVRRAEISYQTVMKWERDVLNELDTLVLHKLLNHFGVTYEQLVYEVDEGRDE